MSNQKAAVCLLLAVVLPAAASCRGDAKRASQDGGGAAPEAAASEEIAQPDVEIVPAGFILHLRLERTEQSKDHNRQLTEVHVADTVVSYGYLYEGFPPSANKTVKKHVNLSPADLEALIALVEKGKLDRDLEEEKPADEIGVAVAVTLEITREGRTTKAAVSGMTSIWGKEMASNIDNAAFLEDVEALVSFVQTKVQSFD
jgi:hypothetical protein